MWAEVRGDVKEEGIQGVVAAGRQVAQHPRYRPTVGEFRQLREWWDLTQQALNQTVLTALGPVEIDIPCDRDGGLTPTVVNKRQQRLSGVDGIVVSLSDLPQSAH